MTNGRVYLRAVADRGKPFRKLGDSFDGDVAIGFWSKDGSTIYFNEGIRATNQLLALDVAKNTVRQLTRRERHRCPSIATRTPACCCSTTPTATTPPTLFTVATVDQMRDAIVAWRQLTDANPQVRSFALGAAGRDHLEVEGRHDGRRRARQAGRLSAPASAIR